ncbi:hypothetical protein HY450_01015 [Candidatus Pacearchaeota archaeon]|nr:hypothetical protein [Candidatus Pacearchaeota archaeon]
MEIDNLPEKVKKAKEAVAELEEPLKTEAFKKILDKLLEPDVPQQMHQAYNQHPDYIPVGNSYVKRKKNNSGKKRKINDTLNQSNAQKKEEAEKRKRELAEKINRTEHPEIHDLQRTLAKSLYVLKIMRDKKVDGLTPPEISYVLKEVFKIKISGELVSTNLNRKEAQKYVDRNRIVVGKAVAYKYKLMKGGEDYLKTELKKNNHVTKAGEKLEPD